MNKIEGLPEIDIPTDLTQIGIYLVMINNNMERTNAAVSDLRQVIKQNDERYALRVELNDLKGRVRTLEEGNESRKTKKVEKLEDGQTWLQRMVGKVLFTAIVSALVTGIGALVVSSVLP